MQSTLIHDLFSAFNTEMEMHSASDIGRYSMSNIFQCHFLLRPKFDIPANIELEESLTQVSHVCELLILNFSCNR